MAVLNLKESQQFLVCFTEVTLQKVDFMIEQIVASRQIVACCTGLALASCHIYSILYSTCAVGH